MYCTKCGTEAVAMAAYCSKCGNSLSETPEVQEQKVEEPQKVEPNAAQTGASGLSFVVSLICIGFGIWAMMSTCS